MSGSTPRFHHVANGSSTTDLLARAGVPGTRSIWADVLHEGPVPEGLSDDDLIAVRARHLAGGRDAAAGAVAAVEKDLRSWRTAIDDVAVYDELVLWYEHDLFDQLNLIQLLSRLRTTVEETRPVTMICVGPGTFPDRPDFKGLGELTPEELAPLFDTRQRVTTGQLALADAAWSAFRAPDPLRLVTILDRDTSDLPFLAPALERLLEELPSTRDGLSRTERRLLELCGAGPADLWTAFREISRGETAFYIADLSFRRVVQALASASPPLLHVDKGTTKPASVSPLPRGTIAATAIGRAAVAGQLDRVARCGIDRWLGGVHLVGHGPVWRWDAMSGPVVMR